MSDIYDVRAATTKAITSLVRGNFQPLLTQLDQSRELLALATILVGIDETLTERHERQWGQQ